MRLRIMATACVALMTSACATQTRETVAMAPTGAATADPENWPTASSPDALTSPATEARIDALLAAMSLEQKVGQLIQADISAISPADLEKYPLGSLLAGGNSGPYGDERADAATWDRLVGEFRAASLKPAANGIAIPIIFGIDAVHGHNNIPGATLFPHNVGLGAARDPDLIRRIGEITAQEVAGSGIEWTFAPTLAVPQDIRWGRAYEGYASDPAIVARYSREMVAGLQGPLVTDQPLASDRVAATAKHFVADGGTTDGKDQGDAAISEAELVAIHAAGYPPAIDGGALTVMASFSSWNGIKHHGNRTLLTDVLKSRLGFDGFVVGDWNGHGQIAGCSVIDCPQAINAGLDMFMAPDSWKGLFESTLSHARDGTIPLTRIDDAVRRILRVKIKLGLLDDPMQIRRDHAAVGAADHLEVAREAVSKSLVLLKNNGSILPIDAGANVLVTGPGADSMAMQSGGWTVSWQGTDVTADDFANGQTIWAALSEAVVAAGGSAQLSADGTFAAKPDVAIVVYGETPYAEYQGDVPTLDYQPAGATDLAMLRNLKAQGIPVVSLFLSGRPMFTNPEINASDAFVAAWLPGSQAGGIADVLVADANGKTKRDFTGTLPFAWPASAAAPVVDALFPLGHGLNYADDGTVAVLSEDPGIDMASALNIDRYFDGGRALAPWALSVMDAGGKRPVGTVPVASPAGLVTARSVDVTAQEDGKAFVWTGPGSFTIEGPPTDLTAPLAQGRALEIEWRVDAAGSADARLVFDNWVVSLAPWLADAPVGYATTVAVPLSCFADSLTHVGNAIRVEADAGFAVTLLGVRLSENAVASQCPPKLN